MNRVELTALLVLVGLVGCGQAPDPNRPRMVPVKAIVTHDGQPVEKATVTFGGAELRGAVGHTNDRGEVVMWTYDEGDGVIPGSYSVAIRKLEVLALPDPDSVSPAEYNRLSRELNAALSGAPRHLLPKRYASAKTSELTVEVMDPGENVFTFALEE
ncbi:hypothetical protein [Blastopirellula marina]|uniref:Carboxypeptidase regulatory-like domain-containing protein n=1 Tax=Blastopirellula marina DSM 3645 TaxID=314230 RepID=A3ZN68_9BACT|nr:hypothetical protein [Blastopirellula marina]EAQ81760.1 hypothetical protein DSM3645_16450 [Blastopirellula marina DSM 3645]